MQSKELMMMAGLLLGLFLVMIVTGVVVIGEGELKSTVCTSENSDYVYEGGACLNETGGTEVSIDAIDDIDQVANNVELILGLIGLVILVLVFLVVIKTARKFGQEA